jgi:hypothetical protein
MASPDPRSAINKIIADEVLAMIERKAKKYGPIKRVVACLEILYGSSIQRSQFKYLPHVLRILDNLARIANGHTEDSFEDIIGYALRGGALSRHLAGKGGTDGAETEEEKTAGP